MTLLLPEELTRSLGRTAGATHHLPLRAGLDTLVGETHLVLCDGQLRVSARASSLDPLLELVGVQSAELLVKDAFQSSLQISHRAGNASVGLGYGEAEKVGELLSIWQLQRMPAPDLPAPDLPAPDLPAPDPRDVALLELRGALLTTLSVRNAELRARLRQAHASRKAIRAREKTGPGRERNPRPKPGGDNPRTRRSTPTEDPARPQSPSPAVLQADPGEHTSALPWIVLGLLVAAGVASAAGRLFAS